MKTKQQLINEALAYVAARITKEEATKAMDLCAEKMESLINIDAALHFKIEGLMDEFGLDNGLVPGWWHSEVWTTDEILICLY